jgi:RNA polymerase sigma-70 factor, ECF subfamily
MLSPLARSAGAVAPAGIQTVADGDEPLVAAAQADPRAFAPLYERYCERIYRYCYFRLGSSTAAEDATSEVFLKAMAALPRYRPGVFAAWLYTIARNVVADHHASRERAPDGLEGIEAAVDERDDERQALLAAVAQLPAEQRTAIELQFAGWSGEEIAASLGKSLPATKMIRYRAVARLRELLDQ